MRRWALAGAGACLIALGLPFSNPAPAGADPPNAGDVVDSITVSPGHHHQFWPGHLNPMQAQTLTPTPDGTTADVTLPDR
jgi:hypothetical protein